MIDLVEDSYKPLHELIGLDLHLWCNAEDLDMENPEALGMLLVQSGGNYIVKSHNGRIGSNKACKVSYRKIYGIAVSKEKNINIKKITFFQCQIFFANDKDPYQYFRFNDVIIGEHCTNEKKFQRLIIDFAPSFEEHTQVNNIADFDLHYENTQIKVNGSYECAYEKYLKTLVIYKLEINLLDKTRQNCCFFWKILMHLKALAGLFYQHNIMRNLDYYKITLIDQHNEKVFWIIQGRMSIYGHFMIPFFIDTKKCFQVWLSNKNEDSFLMGYIWSTCCSISDVNYDVKLMLIVNGLEVCWSKLDEASKHYSKKGIGRKLKDLYNSLGDLQNILNLNINEIRAEENTNNKSVIEPIFWNIAQYRDFFTHFGSDPNHKFNLRLTHNDSSRIYSRIDEVQSKKYTIKVEKWLWIAILQVLGIIDEDFNETAELIKYIDNEFPEFREFVEN
jgi:hypothetical protein